ncbi:MAG TPA: hypothetical protein VFY59_12245 [Rubrobacter sp.]|nr:hypothetical protein [Rubrobacter sp.]
MSLPARRYKGKSREIGAAGLQLAANAQKALAKLGLAEAEAGVPRRASASEIRSWRGKVRKHCSRARWGRGRCM